MSNVTLAAFVLAVVLVVAGVVAEVPAVAGSAGVVLLVGLGYAYVVAKRDAERAAGETVDPAE